jgi:hypothetical protein
MITKKDVVEHLGRVGIKAEISDTDFGILIKVLPSYEGTTRRFLIRLGLEPETFKIEAIQPSKYQNLDEKPSDGSSNSSIATPNIGFWSKLAFWRGSR